MSDKQLIFNILENIHDKLSYAEILSILHFQYEIQKGIRDMENKHTKTTTEVKQIINNSCK